MRISAHVTIDADPEKFKAEYLASEWGGADARRIVKQDAGAAVAAYFDHHPFVTVKGNEYHEEA